MLFNSRLKAWLPHRCRRPRATYHEIKGRAPLLAFSGQCLLSHHPRADACLRVGIQNANTSRNGSPSIAILADCTDFEQQHDYLSCNLSSDKTGSWVHGRHHSLLSVAQETDSVYLHLPTYHKSIGFTPEMAASHMAIASERGVKQGMRSRKAIGISL